MRAADRLRQRRQPAHRARLHAAASWRSAARSAPRRGRLLQHILVEAALLTAGAALVGLGVAALALRLDCGVRRRLRAAHRRSAASRPRCSPGWPCLAAASGVVIGLVPALVRRAAAAWIRRSRRRPFVHRRRRRRAACGARWWPPSSRWPRRCSSPAALVLASLDRLSRVPSASTPTACSRLGVAASAGVSAAEPTARRSGSALSNGWRRCRASQSARSPTAGRRARAGNINNFDLEDRPTPAGENQPVCPWVGVSPGFFKAAGLRLERGRLLDEHSLRDDVVVVDRAWADRFFPGRRSSAAGSGAAAARRAPGRPSSAWSATSSGTGSTRPDQGTVYYPFVDMPSGYFVVRSAGDPIALSPALRQAVRELDPGWRSRTWRPGTSCGRVAGDAAVPQRAHRHVRADGARAVRWSASTA